MFISKKVEHLLSNLEGKENCLIYAENGIAVADFLKEKNCFVSTNTPQLDYSRFAIQFEDIKKEKNKTRKYTNCNGSLIGENVSIGNNTIIEPGCLIDHDVKIGSNCRILSHCIIKNAVIGNNVLITGNSMLAGSVKIEDNVTIYSKVIVREQRKIGKGSIIGMGAVVTKDVPAWETWIGNPAKKIKKNEK